MWRALMVIFGGAYVMIAGILSGGIFTIVLVPLALIGGLGWAGYSALGYFRSWMKSPTEWAEAAESPPHSDHTQIPSRLPTPDQYANARR